MVFKHSLILVPAFQPCPPNLLPLFSSRLQAIPSHLRLLMVKQLRRWALLLLVLLLPVSQSTSPSMSSRSSRMNLSLAIQRCVHSMPLSILDLTASLLFLLTMIVLFHVLSLFVQSINCSFLHTRMPTLMSLVLAILQLFFRLRQIKSLNTFVLSPLVLFNFLLLVMLW